MIGTPPTMFDTAVLKSFDAVFVQLKDQGLLDSRLTIKQLEDMLNMPQQAVIDQILALNPKDYDVSTPYIGLEAVPLDLEIVSGQQYVEQGSVKTLGDKYVPRHVYQAFRRMDSAFRTDYPERKLLIESAYRSPALQLITFINWCTSAYHGDIAKTIRHASPPAYSQHTVARLTALDIKNIDGLPTNENPENFKTTVEYVWLKQRANEFDFYESWPEGNTYNMRAEPWHWQYLDNTQ